MSPFIKQHQFDEKRTPCQADLHFLLNIECYKHIMCIYKCFCNGADRRRYGSAGMQIPTLKELRDKWMEKPHVATFAVLVLFVVSLISIDVLSGYRDYLHRLSGEEVEAYLSEIAAQTSHNLINQFRKNERILRDIGDAVSSAGYAGEDQAMDYIRDRMNNLGYSVIGLIDEESKWHTPYGLQYNTDLKDNVAEVFRRPNASTTHIRITGDRAVAVASAGMVPFTIEGVKYRGIGAMIPLQEAGEVLKLSYFDGQGHANIVTASGESIYPVWMGAGDHFNLFTSLEGTVSDEQIHTIRQNMSFGAKGIFEFKHEDQDRLVYYGPIGLQNWYLLVSVPGSVVETKNAQLIYAVMQVAIGISFLWAVVALAILYHIFQKKRKAAAGIVLQKESQRVQDSLYRLALAHSNQQAIRINLKERTINFENPFSLTDPVQDVWEDFPDSLIQSGRIAKESIKEARRMAQNMLSGIDSGEAILQLRASGDRYAPHRVKFTTLFDEEHLPAYAIITYEDIADIRDKELAQQRWRALLDDFPLDKYRFLEQNLSRDTVDHSEGELFDSGIVRQLGHYDQRMKTFVQAYVHPGDVALFAPVMHREDLLKGYREGKRHIEIEFRLLQHNRDPRWVRMTVQLAEYPETGEIKSYKLFEDVDEEKQKELALKVSSEQDFLTKAFNRGTFEEQVRALLENNADETEHALIIVDVDNFKTINDIYGHTEGDRALVVVAEALRSAFRQTDIIGRLGGDEFAVFVCDITGKNPVMRRMRQMNAMLSSMTGFEFPVTCSAGVAMYPKDGKTFEQLYHNADRALYRAKREGKNGFRFFSDRDGKASVVPVAFQEYIAELKEPADRCYIFQNEEEWRYRGILESTQAIVVELDIATNRYSYDINAGRFLAGVYDERPLDQIFNEDHVADADTAVLIQEMIQTVSGCEDQGGLSTDVLLLASQGYERWFRLRIIKLNRATGSQKLLIVLNDVHGEVLAVEELRRLALYDELTGLHNKDAFVYNSASRIRQADAGAYALIAVDVDRFRVVNELFGFESGNRLLCHIGRILSEEAGTHGEVARLNADQFAVLLPNDAHAIRNVFIPECIRKISESEPNMDVVANFGIYVVQEREDDIIAMIDRAQAAKNIVKGGYTNRYAYYDDQLKSKEQKEKEVISRMHRALANGEFLVYLQPWYDHETGELVGAEALVRWAHPTRGLLYPVDFIPLFEENGFVAELDRFVWKQVCAMQRRLSDEGLQTVPVSVNVSRVDLFDPLFKESLFDIVQKEKICPAMLGIEVTESAFIEDYEQVSDVLRKMGEAGLTLYLDDFGTGYSSLNILKDLPVDVLKFDMRQMSSNGKDGEKAKNILRSIIEMSSSIGVKLVAEGVESKQQADELGKLGCRVVQGFLYAQAMPESEYRKLLGPKDAVSE